MLQKVGATDRSHRNVHIALLIRRFKVFIFGLRPIRDLAIIFQIQVWKAGPKTRKKTMELM